MQMHANYLFALDRKIYTKRVYQAVCMYTETWTDH